MKENALVQLQQKDVHDHHHYQLYESDVIQNLSEMKKQLEKLNEIEDLNISIGEFNSNMANKLDC